MKKEISDNVVAILYVAVFIGIVSSILFLDNDKKCKGLLFFLGAIVLILGLINSVLTRGFVLFTSLPIRSKISEKMRRFLCFTLISLGIVIIIIAIFLKPC